MIQPERLGWVDALAGPNSLEQLVKRRVVNHGSRLANNPKVATALCSPTFVGPSLDLTN